MRNINSFLLALCNKQSSDRRDVQCCCGIVVPSAFWALCPQENDMLNEAQKSLVDTAIAGFAGGFSGTSFGFDPDKDLGPSGPGNWGVGAIWHSKKKLLDKPNRESYAKLRSFQADHAYHGTHSYLVRCRARAVAEDEWETATTGISTHEELAKWEVSIARTGDDTINFVTLKGLAAQMDYQIARENRGVSAPLSLMERLEIK